MPRQKTTSKVETLEKQQAELARKLKEARAKAREESQATESHLNELVGAVARKELAANPSSAFAQYLLTLLRQGLTKAADRAAFDLPPLPKETKPAAKGAAPATAAAPAPRPVVAAPAASPAPAPYSLAAMGGDKNGAV